MTKLVHTSNTRVLAGIYISMTRPSGLLCRASPRPTAPAVWRSRLATISSVQHLAHSCRQNDRRHLVGTNGSPVATIHKTSLG